MTEIGAQVVAHQVKFVLVPGDLAYAGSLDNFLAWKQLMAPVYNAGIGVLPVLGNHDTSDIPAYLQVFGNDVPQNGPAGEVGRTYAFTYNNALIVGLDNYAQLNQVNQPWLNSVLAANTLPHVFTFAHAPAFKANHTDCLDDYPANRDAFWNSLIAANSKVYFCGHDHFYDRSWVNDSGTPWDNMDIYQMIVGSGGAPFAASYAYDGANTTWTPVNQYHAAQYGYAIVTVLDDANVQVDFYQRTGANTYVIADTFTYTATNTPPPTPQPPSSFTVTGVAGKRQAQLTWTVSNLALNYSVFIAPASTGPWTLEKAGLTGTKYTDTKLRSGTQYFYFVRAANNAGQTDSNIVGLTPR